MSFSATASCSQKQPWIHRFLLPNRWGSIKGSHLTSSPTAGTPAASEEGPRESNKMKILCHSVCPQPASFSSTNSQVQGGQLWRRSRGVCVVSLRFGHMDCASLWHLAATQNYSFTGSMPVVIDISCHLLIGSIMFTITQCRKDPPVGLEPHIWQDSSSSKMPEFTSLGFSHDFICRLVFIKMMFCPESEERQKLQGMIFGQIKMDSDSW